MYTGAHYYTLVYQNHEWIRISDEHADVVNIDDAIYSAIENGDRPSMLSYTKVQEGIKYLLLQSEIFTSEEHRDQLLGRKKVVPHQSIDDLVHMVNKMNDESKHKLSQIRSLCQHYKNKQEQEFQEAKRKKEEDQPPPIEDDNELMQERI